MPASSQEMRRRLPLDGKKIRTARDNPFYWQLMIVWRSVGLDNFTRVLVLFCSSEVEGMFLVTLLLRFLPAYEFVRLVKLDFFSGMFIIRRRKKAGG